MNTEKKMKMSHAHKMARKFDRLVRREVAGSWTSHQNNMRNAQYWWDKVSQEEISAFYH